MAGDFRRSARLGGLERSRDKRLGWGQTIATHCLDLMRKIGPVSRSPLGGRASTIATSRCAAASAAISPKAGPPLQAKFAAPSQKRGGGHQWWSSLSPLGASAGRCVELPVGRGVCVIVTCEESCWDLDALERGEATRLAGFSSIVGPREKGEVRRLLPPSSANPQTRTPCW